MKKNFLPALSKNTDLSSYLLRVSKIKKLSLKEEKELVQKVYTYNDKDAANKLVVSHLPLVIKIAFSFKGYGIPIMDLISEGNLGLIQAVTKFDVSKNVRVSTYAMWWIRAYITDYIIRSWSLVKQSSVSAQKKLFFSLNRLKNKLNIYSPTITEENAKSIASNVNGVTSKDVVEVNNMVYFKDYSLDTPVSRESAQQSFGDTLASDISSPEDVYISVENDNNKKSDVKKLFSVLNEREKYIIYHRYLADPTHSLQKIGDHLSLSRERVRQIESSILKKAKTLLS